MRETFKIRSSGPDNKRDSIPVNHKFLEQAWVKDEQSGGLTNRGLCQYQAEHKKGGGDPEVDIHKL